MRYSTRAILICLLFVCTLQPFPTMAAAQGEGWLDGWDRRATITVTNSTGAGTDYQIGFTVPYRSVMQSDFDDLRFTDDDGLTELDYWMEDYTADTSAAVWVEVTDSLEVNQTIFMYYGNDAVSTTSNGEETFLFYEDWSDGVVNTTRWDIQDSLGSVGFAGGGDHGQLATVSANAGASVYRIESDLHYSAPFALRFRSNIEQTAAASQRTIQGMGTAWGDAAPCVLVFNSDGGEYAYYRDDDANTDQSPTNGTLLDVQTTWETQLLSTTGTVLANDLYYDSGDTDPSTDSINMALIYVRDSEYTIISDWIVARKFVSSEPLVFIGAWNEAATAQFILPANWDPAAQFGYDMFFIVLGLIMIPASTMYLVRGGRKEMSTDKIFYALILFFVGIGLVIGGVMP